MSEGPLCVAEIQENSSQPIDFKAPIQRKEDEYGGIFIGQFNAEGKLHGVGRVILFNGQVIDEGQLGELWVVSLV